jgi:protein SCO1/2
MKTIPLFCVIAVAGASVALWGPRLFRSDAPDPGECCGVASVAAAQPAAAPAPAAAPVDPSVPLPPKSLYHLDSSWTDDTGKARQLVSLRGEPVVIAMIFTNCEYACPMIVTDLMRIRAALPEKDRARTRFVLVSFDDVRDTPPVLRAYRAKMTLEDPAWTLLHGEAPDVQELALLLGVKFKQDARGQFAHSNLISVLNPAGEVAFQREGLRGDTDEVVRAVGATLK